MKIAIEFLSGRIKEYDTSTFCASDPWGDRSGSPFVVSIEFDLRTDLVEGTGQLRLDIIRHTARLDGKADSYVELDEYVTGDGKPARMPATERVPSCSVVLADERELECASLVSVEVAGDKKVVLWRQGRGNWLVNGVRFDSAQRTFYSDATATSTTSQALRLANYIANAYPDLTDEEVAYSIGFSPEALEDARRLEGLNADSLSDGPAPEGDAGAAGPETGGAAPSDADPVIEVADSDDAYADDDDEDGDE